MMVPQKYCEANTLNYMVEVPPITDLTPSQADCVLSNGLKPSPFIQVPNYPIVNGAVTPPIIYPTAWFHYKFIPAAPIPAGTREVGGLGFLLEKY